MTKTALGRGFEGLIPTNLDVEAVATPGEQIRQMDLSKIKPNPDQPRREFDEASLRELAASIKQHGIIQPLVVTPRGDIFRIVAGERRFRAAGLAGLKKVPVIVRNHKELEELEIALVENVQRVDLSPLEQAVSIARLRDQFSLSPKDIAQKLGKAETTISNTMRLLQLPGPAVEALRKGQITEGHARAILALKADIELQQNLLNKIITQKLSVRAAEQFVRQSRSKKTSESAEDTISLQGPWRERVSIKRGRKNSGVLSIKYKDADELEDLKKRLS